MTLQRLLQPICAGAFDDPHTQRIQQGLLNLKKTIAMKRMEKHQYE